jgi:aminoglycoside/choline kinase family phosphotransferase
MGVRTPLELIQIYWDQVYNEMDVERVREVCADPILRHDPSFVTPLSHDEQIERILRTKPMRPLFTHKVLHADDHYVTSVWNMVTRDGRDVALCGIEVFRAENGRFTDCWNSTYMKGLWGDAEDIFDPAALPPPALIASSAGIDADWLQRAFAAGGRVQAQRIATQPVITPIGHGTTSETVHVRVAYNSGHLTAPTQVVCKLGKRSADAVSDAGPFDRELRAYALFGDQPDFRVPRIYYAANDPASGLGNLVLEDLTQTARAGDQIAGCSIEEATAATTELGRLHRAYWKRPELAKLDWLSRPKALLPVYAKGAAVLREWLSDRIPADQLQLVDDFGRLAERWVAAGPRFSTLLHGDPRVDNILFETVDGGIRACLIDWQNLTHGDPQYDLAYLLTGSLSPEDRRACERDLVAAHARLIAEIDPAYSVETALESYRGNIVSGLWLTVVAAAFVERDAHNARLLETLVGRNVAAVRDWDGLAAIG